MRERVLHFLAGTFGGMLPTLVKLGTSLTTQPDQPMPILGFYLGLLILGVVGGGFAVALAKPADTFRDYVFRGIVAPALISSMASASSLSHPPALSWISPIGTAFGQERSDTRYGLKAQPHGHSELLFSSSVGSGIQPAAGPLKIDAVENGASTHLADVAVGTTTSLQIPPGTDSLLISAGTQHQSVPIEADAKSIRLHAVVWAKATDFGDLAWAFGARRVGTVRDLYVTTEPGGTQAGLKKERGSAG